VWETQLRGVLLITTLKWDGIMKWDLGNFANNKLYTELSLLVHTNRIYSLLDAPRWRPIHIGINAESSYIEQLLEYQVWKPNYQFVSYFKLNHLHLKICR
jgi:hypothetical protein